MYKDLFKLAVLLISRPGKAWEILACREEKQDVVLGRFVYPLIGMLTLSAFLGEMLLSKEFEVEMALKASVRELTAVFGGFFLAAYALNELGVRMFNREKDVALWQRFIGYSSCLMYILNAILMLIPEFFFLRVFLLYTFYIVWEGAGIYMPVEEYDRMKFTGIVTLAILVTPYLIRFALSLLMPGMRF
ncbi:MAG: hypothetical protein LBU03_00700 [Tannerellaceae bacterium]|jgi:hypothetical protein|nr:hypothetical protein [Tannerellaceae bacterium]